MPDPLDMGRATQDSFILPMVTRTNSSIPISGEAGRQALHL